MADSVEVAVIGADSLAGAALLERLADWPGARVHALAHGEAPPTVSLGEEELELGAVDTFDFAGVRFAFFAGAPIVAAEFAPRAADAGAIAIDLSSCFDADPEVPLVLARGNGEEIARGRARGIIGAVDGLVAQLLLPLLPLHAAAGIQSIAVVSLIGAAAGGRAAVEELGRQTADLLNFREAVPAAFARPIAFNLLPAAGFGRDEAALARAVHKIMADERILVDATSAQVPVFHGNSQWVRVRTHRLLDVDEAQELMAGARGVSVAKGDAQALAATDASGRGEVIVGAVREDRSMPGALAFWSVADGHHLAAANALEIAAEAPS